MTPEEIDSIVENAPDNAQVTVFCIDGVIVEIPIREALKRLPCDVMMMQKDMHDIIVAQGKMALFLSPMHSDMLLGELNKNIEAIPNSPWSVKALDARQKIGAKLENINKETANAVAALYGSEPVFGPDDDGILPYPTQEPIPNDPESYFNG